MGDRDRAKGEQPSNPGDRLSAQLTDSEAGLETAEPLQRRLAERAEEVEETAKALEAEAVETQHQALEGDALLQRTAPQDSQLEAVLESSEASLALLDAELNIRRVNSAFLADVPYTRDDLIGRSYFEHFPQPDLRAEFARVQETGEAFRAVERPFVFSDHAERGVTYWNWLFQPVRRSAGQPERYLLSVVNVTAQVELRQQLQQLVLEGERRAAELDTVLASVADGLMIHDTDGRIVRLNRTAEQLLGYTAAEQDLSLARRADALGFADAAGQRSSLDDLPTQRALRGERVHGEELAVHRDGRTLWLTVSAAPLRTRDGEIAGAVVTLTDTTETRDLQERRKVMLHSVSHDLRAPLTVIQGHAQLLRTALADPEVEVNLGESVEAITRGARRMKAMLADLSEFARSEGGRLSVRPRPLDLSAYLNELLERYRTGMEVARVRLDLPDVLPEVQADPDSLERIVTNLLGNALKYSAAETEVLVAARVEAAQVSVSVVDRGRGIAAEDLPHVFEQFRQAGREPGAEGLGLGLYIVRMLVEAHSGRIAVESTPGEGSTFTFTLRAVAR